MTIQTSNKLIKKFILIELLVTELKKARPHLSDDEAFSIIMVAIDFIN